MRRSAASPSALQARELRQATVMQQLLSARVSQLHGSPAASVPVTESTAMSLASFFACVRIISETKGSLPLQVFERVNGRDVETTQHDLVGVLQVEPNADQTPMVCNEQRQAHLCSWGNSISILHWGTSGELLGIEPVHPSRVEPYRDQAKQLRYRISGYGDYDRSQILHVPGLALEGIWGMSPLRQFAGTIGIGLQYDRHVAGFFGNAAKPSLVVTSKNKLTDTRFFELKSDLENNYTGSNAGRPLLLEGDMSVTPISMPFDEMQLIDLMKFNGETLATRVFRLPPHVAGFLEHATFNNVEQQDLYFEKHTMRPWCIRDEQEMNRKLFSRQDRGRFRVKHNVDAILRSDIRTRYESYRTALLAGFETVNEVRALEDLPPLPGGDELPRPASVWGKQPDQAKAATDPPKDPAERSAADPRLIGLATQTIEGLFQRAAHQAERLAGKPGEYSDRLQAFFESHRSLVAERLQQLAGDRRDQVADVLLRHEQQLAAVAGEPDLPAAVTRVIAGWKPDAAQLAESLLK